MDHRSEAGDGRPLHVLCYLHAVELGGVERAALRLCAAWTQDARVTLALGRRDGWRGIDAPVEVRSAPRPPISPARWETLWMVLWLPWVVVRRRPDVVFCAGNTYTVVAVALKLLLGRRCPPIVAKVSNSLVRPHLPGAARRLHAWWCRIQGRAIDRFVGMTPAMTGEVQGELGVPAGRTATIASPLFDDASLARLTAARDRGSGPGRLLVAVGRLEPQKNFALLLAAFARSGPGDRLAIIGAGAERARLSAAIARLDLVDRVTLVGHDRDVAAWLRRADALVLSSDYEGVPAVVLEAMAAGLPVIATDCCASMPGLLADGRGVLVPCRDPAALAAAMATLPPPEHDPAAQRAFARRHGVREAARTYLRLFHALAAAPTTSLPHPEHAYP